MSKSCLAAGFSLLRCFAPASSSPSPEEAVLSTWAAYFVPVGVRRELPIRGLRRLTTLVSRQARYLRGILVPNIRILLTRRGAGTNRALCGRTIFVSRMSRYSRARILRARLRDIVVARLRQRRQRRHSQREYDRAHNFLHRANLTCESFGRTSLRHWCSRGSRI